MSSVSDDMLAYLGIQTGLNRVSLQDLERAYYAVGGGTGGGVAGVSSVEGRSGVVTLSDLFASIAALAGKANTSHSHAETDVTNLGTDLANKAASTHTHNETDVTNLSTDLSGKAATGHTHTESGITNLVADLAGKSNTGHSHGESEVTNLVADLTGKSNTGHSHTESDVASLVADLTGKSNTGHSHVEADVTSLSSDLSGKAPNDHRVSHLPGGTNAMSGYGTAAAKPSATTVPDGYVYFETNTNGGTLWQNQANTWVQIAVGVAAANGYEIAYAENISGTTQVIAAGGNADITGCSITVPITARPVWIRGHYRAHITAVVGTPAPNVTSAVLGLYEGGTLIEVMAAQTVPNGSTGSTSFTVEGEVRIGPTVASRTFKLNATAPGTATNGYSMSVDNNASIRSWIRAMAL